MSILQPTLFKETYALPVAPFKTQLLKWVGNKQRFAHEIASHFPEHFNTYYEPFLGSGAVLGTLAPEKAVGSDCFLPLIEIWQTLHERPETLKAWYRDRWMQVAAGKKAEVYEQIKASYNKTPNGADLLFLCRSCYGGVVRFRKNDGYMSTPCGVHSPISPESFDVRANEWYRRTSGTTFIHADYKDILRRARRGDLVYCDPPYSDSQAILYGAQSFRFDELIQEVADAKARGVYVAVNIDGTKKSGKHLVEVDLPRGLFEREMFVNIGRSMLKRFQMNGQTLEREVVTDRLLLTYQ